MVSVTKPLCEPEVITSIGTIYYFMPKGTMASIYLYHRSTHFLTPLSK